MIVETELKMFEINYQCDICHDGIMVRSDDLMLMSCPPQYNHKCNKCGAEERFSVIYPYTAYEKLD